MAVTNIFHVEQDNSLQQHYRAYIGKTYKEHVKQSPEGQGLSDKALDKLVLIAQTFLQFYLDAAGRSRLSGYVSRPVSPSD